LIRRPALTSNEVTVRVRLNPLLYRIALPVLPPRATNASEEEKRKWEAACLKAFEQMNAWPYRPVRPAVVFIVWHAARERDPDQVAVRTVVNTVVRWGLAKADDPAHIKAIVTSSRETDGGSFSEIWVTRPQEAPEVFSGILGL